MKPRINKQDKIALISAIALAALFIFVIGSNLNFIIKMLTNG